MLSFYMITKNRKKKSPKFSCEKCDFYTSDKKDWKRHVLTLKHRGYHVGNTYMCGLCGKKYSYRSGLSRHKKNCKKNFTAITGKPDFSPKIAKSKNGQKWPKSDPEVLKLIKKQQEIQEKILKRQEETENKILDIYKTGTTINYNNCTNQKMTINVFLNEQCKNAMNITEFIENLKVSLADLEYTNMHGYAKGISNIFEKHLTDLKPTERPIHCSDKKRLQFYIKDEDQWKKDNEHEKIDKSIQDITMKQIKQLKEWEKKNPNYLKEEKLMMEWHSMVRSIMGGSEDSTIEKNKEQIKKTLGNVIEIKVAMEDDKTTS